MLCEIATKIKGEYLNLFTGMPENSSAYKVNFFAKRNSNFEVPTSRAFIETIAMCEDEFAFIATDTMPSFTSNIKGYYKKVADFVYDKLKDTSCKIFFISKSLSDFISKEHFKNVEIFSYDEIISGIKEYEKINRKNARDAAKVAGVKTAKVKNYDQNWIKIGSTLSEKTSMNHLFKEFGEDTSYVYCVMNGTTPYYYKDGEFIVSYKDFYENVKNISEYLKLQIPQIVYINKTVFKLLKFESLKNFKQVKDYYNELVSTNLDTFIKNNSQKTYISSDFRYLDMKGVDELKTVFGEDSFLYKTLADYVSSKKSTKISISSLQQYEVKNPAEGEKMALIKDDNKVDLDKLIYNKYPFIEDIRISTYSGGFDHRRLMIIKALVDAQANVFDFTYRG